MCVCQCCCPRVHLVLVLQKWSCLHHRCWFPRLRSEYSVASSLHVRSCPLLHGTRCRLPGGLVRMFAAMSCVVSSSPASSVPLPATSAAASIACSRACGPRQSGSAVTLSRRPDVEFNDWAPEFSCYWFLCCILCMCILTSTS